MAVVEKLLFIGTPAPKDGLASVEADEFAVAVVAHVVEVSMEGLLECWIACGVSGTAGGDIWAPISANGAELDFLGRLIVADLLNIDGSLARPNEVKWPPSTGCFSW